MATSVISGKIINSSGTAVAGVTVVATLRPYGFRISDSSSVAPRQTTTTASDGTYSFTLERNSGITPSNAWYEIEEQIAAADGGRRVYAITVGAISATVYASLIITPPDAGTASQYLTQAAGDARYEAFGSAVLKSLGTAQGDLAYWSASGVPARLAKSTNGSVMTLASGIPSWNGLSKDSATLGADVALPAATTTTVFTTASLAIGTWLLMPSLSISFDGASDGGACWVEAGGATCTFSGQASVEIYGGGSTTITATSRRQVSWSTIVNVTVAGTVLIRANLYQAGKARKSDLVGGRLVSGYTAVRIA